MAGKQQTLEELKAENEAEETETKEETVTLEGEGSEAETEEETSEADNSAESESEEGDETEVEAWKQGDEHESSDQQVPVAKHAHMRAKLKGKIGERDEEIQKLNDKIDALERGSGSHKPSGDNRLPPRPKLEDFDHDQDKYDVAIDEWQDKRIDAKLETSQQTRQQADHARQQRETLNQSVDQHYERAAKLAEDSGIKPEVYQQSDLTVRTMIERIRPGQGDVITDQLISTIGEGSEKVIYHLGRNQAARDQLQSALLDDPSGMKAIALLGRKAAELSSPGSKRSRAPKPASNAAGDESSGNQGRGMKSKYESAHKAGNSQEAYNIKKAARQKKIDVSDW